MEATSIGDYSIQTDQHSRVGKLILSKFDH
jgi:hypothetical protein